EELVAPADDGPDRGPGDVSARGLTRPDAALQDATRPGVGFQEHQYPRPKRQVPAACFVQKRLAFLGGLLLQGGEEQRFFSHEMIHILVGWAESSRPTVSKSVGLEDSAHPTLSCARRWPNPSLGLRFIFIGHCRVQPGPGVTPSALGRG